ncbi:hypothetical protein AB5J62_24125 [Amycolatopsis sp. cg5]|uniref:hypothetical protein n=1 Tax=Amycolatopsis sp. cg5 TaxID=3238802 RepID=UPI0035245D3B
MGTTRYTEKISEDELCAVLGIDERGLRKLQRRDLPKPTGEDDAGVWRSIPEVRGWLAATSYRRPKELLLEWWADAEVPAQLRGAELARSDHVDGQVLAVLQRWETSSGRVVLAWPTSVWSITGADLARWVPAADAYLLVGHGWGSSGPDVWAHPGAHPDTGRTDIEWRDVARVFGRPVPFWPYRLRHPELIVGWKPGDPPVRHVGVLDSDIEPLMRMALLYPPEHTTHRAMIQTAQAISNRADAADCSDLKILSDRLASGHITDKQIVLAAEAAPNAGVDLPEPDETLARAGWQDVLRRSDRLAEHCVRLIRAWDGGPLWPYAHTVSIPRGTEAGAEFLARLEPSPRTAAHYAIDVERTARPMVDPDTDIPVALPDGDGQILAIALQRLPTTSPLAELILEETIWIRTQDGGLFPAPHNHHSGLLWGYEGAGPSALAALANALLVDITAEGASSSDNTPPGLHNLFQRPWPSGTVLTRTQLKAARGR